MKRCHRCGRAVELTSALQRTDSCQGCYSDLKCCLNCRFFDPAANNQCREPQAEWCPEKEKANFCEFFHFLEVADAASGGRERPADARSAFDALFRRR